MESDNTMAGFGSDESCKNTQRAKLILSTGPALIIVPINISLKDADRLKKQIDLFAENTAIQRPPPPPGTPVG